MTPAARAVFIAYEDDFAAVLNKPAGIAVHPTLNYPDGTLGQRLAVPPAAAGAKRHLPPGKPH